MRKTVRTLWLVVLGISLVSASRSSAQDNQPTAPGAVFVMTNAVNRNEIISFARAADGSLQQGRRFATGGRGSGGVTDPLESQGSLTLSQNHDFRFAVNGGSEKFPCFSCTALVFG
jgi:6-phosphogluconolactonase